MCIAIYQWEARYQGYLTKFNFIKGTVYNSKNTSVHPYTDKWICLEIQKAELNGHWNKALTDKASMYKSPKGQSVERQSFNMTKFQLWQSVE